MSNVTDLPKSATQQIIDEAKKEIIEARAKDAKVKIKTKLGEIERAKLIVSNLERELEVLIAQVKAEIEE